MLSASAYEAYYERALQIRHRLSRDFATAFRQCGGVHVLLTPTTPTPPFPIASPPPTATEMYANDAMTVPVNLAGLPALSLPVTKARINVAGTPIAVPIGMQLIAPPNTEETLLRIARTLETAAGFSAPEHIFDLGSRGSRG